MSKHKHQWTRCYTAVLHRGEYPWDTWQHVCQADAKRCVTCGEVRRRWMGRKKCASGWVIKLPPQPYAVSHTEWNEAARALSNV